MELSRDVNIILYSTDRALCRSRRREHQAVGIRYRMIHYTCDRCKRQIDASQTRYVVQIEIQAAEQGCTAEFEDDVDHLTELHQILESMSDDELESIGDETEQLGSYDLCPVCHEQFLKNPLGRDAMLALGFSNN